MRQNARKKIALLLSQDLGHYRRVFSGILNYAEEKELDWVFHDAQPDVRVMKAVEAWRPDGILVHLFDRELEIRLMELGLPIISTTDTLKEATVPQVDVDNFAVGEMAANYFLLSLGHQSFGYYGSSKTVFSGERERGFRSVLEKKGFKVSKLHADFLPGSPIRVDWDYMDNNTSQWLLGLRKPVAILASNDIPARALTEICRNMGLRVPEDIAILGVDNDQSECRLASPSLSSVDLPAERVGYLAAGMLNTLLSGEQLEQKSVRLLPRNVIVRSSTDVKSNLSPILKRALKFISNSADKAIKVSDVATAAGCSRRVLEHHFRNELGQSVLNQIQTERINIARRLLLETNVPIKAIVEKCGLNSLRQLDRIFKRFEGCSPSAYRQTR